jgi:putative acetyltransferase
MAETIRSERPGDEGGIRAVLEAAFGREAEAALVEALRARGALDVSLVAVEGERIAGHVAFSPVTAERNPRGVALTGLGPIGVLPARQGEGVGARLVWEGLEASRRRGIAGAVVLGDPAWYARFGFRRADTFGLACEFEAPPEAFMALALVDGALDELDGVVAYHPAFREV